MPGHVSGDAPFSKPCIKHLPYNLHPSMPYLSTRAYPTIALPEQFYAGVCSGGA